MPTFGKRKSERPASTDAGGGGGRELYLKTFGEGSNRIAVLEDDPENWVDMMEHFDNGLKISYPCAAYEEPGSDCVGCRYPVEHEEYSDLDTHFPGLTWREQKDARKKADKGWGVRDRGQKWIFPCIDSKNYISIFKVGKELHDEFIRHYKALGSLMSMEFVVQREGTGFNTKTGATPVPGEVRKPRFPVPGATEIGQSLGAKYAHALEKYGYDPVEQESPSTPAYELPSDKAPEAPNTGPAAEGTTPEATAPFIPREASAGEIKDWLENVGKVEFPAKAPRQVLVGLAEKRLTEMAAASPDGEPPF